VNPKTTVRRIDHPPALSTKPGRGLASDAVADSTPTPFPTEAAGMDEQTTERQPPPVRCWCAITSGGNLVPWMCDTDRERLMGDIARRQVPWRVVPVRIVPDGGEE
jgi:hypothetical protein